MPPLLLLLRLVLVLQAAAGRALVAPHLLPVLVRGRATEPLRRLLTTNSSSSRFLARPQRLLHRHPLLSIISSSNRPCNGLRPSAAASTPVLLPVEVVSKCRISSNNSSR